MSSKESIENNPDGLSPLAYKVMDGNDYPPYIAPERSIPELTFKAIIIGAIIGIVFGAANAYLGLKVGMTVSASIPAAVIGVAIFKFLKRGTILETNMVQTIGSAGESLAAGVIFTLPVLYLWGYAPGFWPIFPLALLGGLLGVLCMIPLRKYLIVKEHGKLVYPEGTACAEVLVASQKPGSQAKILFSGLGIGMIYSILYKFFHLFSEEPDIIINKLTFRTSVGADVTPELLGVGYIIGPKVSAVMLAGGTIGWLVIIPLIYMFGGGTIVSPETAQTVASMDSFTIWSRYLRYIGAGAVAFGGIFTLIKSLPVMINSFRLSFAAIFTSSEDKLKEKRTNRDISFKWVILGLAFIFICVLLLSMVVPRHGMTPYYESQAELLKKSQFLITLQNKQDVQDSEKEKHEKLIKKKIHELLFVQELFRKNMETMAKDLKGESKYKSELVSAVTEMKAFEKAFIKGKISQDILSRQEGLVKKLKELQTEIHSDSAFQQTNKYDQYGKIGIWGGIAVVVFGFFFVTVSSRIVGLLGSSSNPISGMTIATVLLCSILFGAGGISARILVLTIGALVCIAAAIAGDTSQDLKTGHLIGATPRKQQIGEIIGVICAAIAMSSVLALFKTEIVSGAFKAPQANLIKLVIDGVLSDNLPWALVFIGMAIAFCVEIMGLPTLAFAVGLYLPIHLAIPIMVGGLIRLFVEKRYTGEQLEKNRESGVLYSSGLIAGAASIGVLAAAINLKWSWVFELYKEASSANWIPAVIAYFILALTLFILVCKKKKE